MTAAKKHKKSPPITLEFGTQSQFDSLRKLLEASGYTTEIICDRLGVSSIFELETLSVGPMTLEGFEDACDVLLWLFLGLGIVVLVVLAGWLPPPLAFLLTG